MSDNEDDLDAPAGVPRKGAQGRLGWIISAAIGIPIVGGLLYLVGSSCMSTTWATTIATISVADSGAPTTQRVQIAQGTLLTFALSTGYSYTGNVRVMLSVTLQRGGLEVAKTECNMKSLGGVGGGIGSGGNTWYGDAGWTCKLTAPPGGADAVRVAIDKRGTGSLELRQPTVLVKKP